MFSHPLFDDSTSSDDESSHEEVIHEMSFKTYSNPLFDLDEEIISSEFNLIHNEDLDSTPKDSTGCFFKTYSITIIESLPTFHIPVKDSDSLREEIDIFPGPDDSIPSGIESDDFDSEDRNRFTDPVMHEVTSTRFLATLSQRIARIFEASRARGFCPSFTRASHPQLHYGNPIS
ncbi:hypothetical protein Tco_0164785 [Tanacetum coccineum]